MNKIDKNKGGHPERPEEERTAAPLRKNLPKMSEPNSVQLLVIHDTMRIINQLNCCYQRHLDAEGNRR